MLVIEFVNHIESLAVDYGKVWRGENVSLALLFANAKRIDALQVAALSRLALRYRREDPLFFIPLSPPKENIRGRYLQKYPATLKLEDKWMV